MNSGTMVRGDENGNTRIPAGMPKWNTHNISRKISLTNEYCSNMIITIA
jgi:hypothetical protein